MNQPDHPAADLLRRIKQYRDSLDIPTRTIPVTLRRSNLLERLAKVPRIWRHCWRFGRAIPLWQRVRFAAFNVSMLFRKS